MNLDFDNVLRSDSCLVADGSSKQSQTAYDMAYLLNGKFQRKESNTGKYL